MTQLEFDLRPPLTVQLELPFDYSNCHKQTAVNISEMNGGTINLCCGNTLLGNFRNAISTPMFEGFTILNPEKDIKGRYEILPNFRIESKNKPSFVKRLITKHLLGWKWIDK